MKYFIKGLFKFAVIIVTFPIGWVLMGVGCFQVLGGNKKGFTLLEKFLDIIL